MQQHVYYIFRIVFNLKFKRLILHPMKIFALIMAIVVFVLSCMPCMDRESIVHDGQAKAQISKVRSHSALSDADDCSPFCMCNCCAGFTIMCSSIKITPIINVVSQAYLSYLPVPIFKISLPVWQPPQLA